VQGLRIGSVFSGIGALDIALHNLLPDSETVWFVEENQFCQKLLRKRFLDTPIYDDVCKVGEHNLSPIDILVGGFPCQDISTAGEGAGISKGTRSGLFFEMWRIAQELQPRVVLFENVPAITIRGLDDVAEMICSSGWSIEWFALSASDVGAYHKRERWWGIAHREPQPLFGQYEIIGELQDGWRTLQQGLFGSPSVIEKMPRSGMVRDGLLYQRPQADISSSLYPTPVRNDGHKMGTGCLERIIKCGTRYSANDHRSEVKEQEWLAGKLNPDWVEPLMGLPVGYTDLEKDIAPSMIEVSSWEDGSWEEGLARLTERKDNRVSRIQSLGNSVVPQCAHRAYSIIRRLKWQTRQ